MDLIETNGNYIIRNGSQALFCDRLSGKLTVKESTAIHTEWNPICLGKIDGVIGKIRYFPGEHIFFCETAKFLLSAFEFRMLHCNL
ncbi:hypothetical protein PHET_05820 [Paragonimus heterotremus]|uniref:Uncharacterized protein n=1 Tax=Paragonimus heterotremus TaxID=100268 RepID=A0A8J4SNV3_9TREM|nr:hypothetical protein PHET_05820 [Paragonimus heterotremus]